MVELVASGVEGVIRLTSYAFRVCCVCILCSSQGVYSWGRGANPSEAQAIPFPHASAGFGDEVVLTTLCYVG